MAVEIKSGDSSELATVDAASKAVRVTNYDSAGNEIIPSLPIAIPMGNVTVVNNDLISSLEVTAYKSVSVQLTGTWAGAVSCQGSIDGGDFYDIAVQDPSELAVPYVKSLTTNILVKIPIIFKYLRVRATAYTSGTISGVALGYKEDNATGQISATGKMTIADTAGTVIGPMIVGLEGQPHLPTAMIQDVFLSAANTTTTNLDAGQIFIGESQSTKSVNSIDVSAECNENLTIEVQQSELGVHFNHGIPYQLLAGVPDQRNFKALSGFYRIKVTNTSANTTTNLHVSTTLTPISEVLPAALSQAGNLKTAVVEALPAGANTIGSIDDLAKLGGAAVSMGTGVADAGTQRVVLPDSAPLSTDFYLTQVEGSDGVNVNSRMLRTGACHLVAAIMTTYAATPRHIKLYDTATAPVAGVGTPVLVLSRASSGNNAYPLPAGGYPFANGIGMTFVQGAANNDDTGTATVDASLTSIFT